MSWRAQRRSGPRRGLRARFCALYGAGPLHLALLLACFAVALISIQGWAQRPRDLELVIVWFVAAIVLHDLLAAPAYTLLDRLTLGRLARSRRRRVPAAYVRVPALVSAIVLAVSTPVIFGLGASTERSASGIVERGYLARWLIFTAAVFALSALTLLAGRAANALRRLLRGH